MAEKRKLTKEEKKMLDIMETALDHCDHQIAMYKGKDPNTAMEWIVRSITIKKLLDAFNDVLKPVRES